MTVAQWLRDFGSPCIHDIEALHMSFVAALVIALCVVGCFRNQVDQCAQSFLLTPHGDNMARMAQAATIRGEAWKGLEDLRVRRGSVRTCNKHASHPCRALPAQVTGGDHELDRACAGLLRLGSCTTDRTGRPLDTLYAYGGCGL